MCMNSTCSTCAKASWRGCGRHIPSALKGFPESDWCDCEPKVIVDGVAYPPAVKILTIPTFMRTWIPGGWIAGGQQHTEETKNGN